MSTTLQKNLAKEIIKNTQRKKPLTKKELVVSSGYDMTTAEKQVPAVFNQKGVKDELRRLGLTEELITNALVEDIENKKGNRLGEMRLGAEILGMNENELGGNKTLIINIVPETATRYDIAKKEEL